MNTHFAVKKRFTSVLAGLFLASGLSAQPALGQELTAVVSFALKEQPSEASGAATGIAEHPNIISEARLPELPEGAVITGAELSVPGLSTIGGSFGSDVVFGLSGALNAEYMYGDHAPECAGNFDFYSMYEYVKADPAAGRSIYLHYYDLTDDNPGAETIFPTGRRIARLVIHYLISPAAGTESLPAESTQQLPELLVPGLYPNPTSGIVSISTPGGLSGIYTVSDAHGKVICSGALLNNAFIDFTTMESGVYMIRMITGNATYIQKIIRQ